jgi:hypothetical protein
MADTTSKHYDAATGKEVANSPQFLDDVKKMPTKTKVAATKWIAQGGAGVADAEDDVDYIGDTFVTDKEGDDSLDDPVLDPLKQYNEFQASFIGAPQSPEMSSFLDAAGVGLDKLDEIQRSLLYRKNTNAWMQKRQTSTSNSQNVTSSLKPPTPSSPTSPIPLKKADPTASKKAPGATKNNPNVERLLPYAKKWAGVYGFPVELACALIQEESGFQPWVVNPAAKSNQGAYGCMQMTLGTAMGMGFSGTPHWAQRSSAVSPECRVVAQSESYGSLYLPVEGADLYDDQSWNQKRWEAGDDSMGKSTSCLLHPDTNIMYGCQYFAKVLEKAFTFGCFTRTSSGELYAITPNEAKKNGYEIVSPVGLTGQDALNWAFQRYNSSAGRIRYAQNALKFKDDLAKAIPEEDKKPPTDAEKKAAISQYEQTTGGTGKIRQLKSFHATWLNALRA